MRSSTTYIFVALTILLAATSYGDGAAALEGDGTFVVSERDGELVLEVTAPPPDSAPLPKRRFYVAVPRGGSVRVERVGGQSVSRPMGPDELALFEQVDPTGATRLPAGLFPSQPVSISDPFTFRKTSVVAVDCYLRQLDSETQTAIDWSGYRVIVRYPPRTPTTERRYADPLVADIVKNRDVFPASSRALSRSPAQGGADPQFSKSDQWIRLEVERRGVYVVTGADLADITPLSAVGDPATFRMFTGSGFGQKRDLRDPDASWRPGNWMRELRIRVEDGGDGVFDAGDRVVFYGLGADNWSDFYDPSLPDTVYHSHYRAMSNFYYLTWEGNFSGQPLRMQDVPAAPAGGPERTTFRERVYLEKNKVSDYDYGGDFWLWEKVGRGTRQNEQLVLERVNILDIVPGVPHEYRTVALAPYTGKVDTVGVDNYWDRGHHAVYLCTPPGTFNPVTVGHYRWDTDRTEYDYSHGRPVFLTGSFLGEGENRLDLMLPRDDNVRDWMYFAWLSLAYERRLRVRGGRLGFASPDTAVTIDMRVADYPSTGTVYVFDVSDRFSVRRLTNVDVAGAGGGTRRARFSTAPAGARKYFWTTTDNAFFTPKAVRLFAAVDLRDVNVAPRMLIVTDALSSFQTAAGRLAAYRTSHLGRYGSGTVDVVTTQDIYDNFSGGQPDPFAIRNYIKFLYELSPGNPDLAYVLFFGDATIDYKHHASSAVDRVPTIVFDLVSNYEETFATDELYAHLDESDQVPGYGVGDVGIGRLPAASSSEANALVDKVIAYESEAPLGPWRNQVILVADDEAPAPKNCEPWFTNSSEFMALIYSPQYVDLKKIYLTDYPSLAGPKPASRRDFIEEWNNGAVIIHYVGHGSSVQIADEIVFVDDDVPKLHNGLRLPIFMAMSCTVGDFANPSKKSLSEELLLRGEGGAIATVTASALSGIFTNEYLSFAMFENVLPLKPGRGVALGEDVMKAKLDALSWNCGPGGQPCGLITQELNDWKYNLLSDPALRIKVPKQEIELIPETPDELVAGVRKKIRGAVMKDGEIDTGFNGSVEVRVHEPDELKVSSRCALTYRLRGGAMYRGSADVVGGRFEFDFRVPRYATPGPRAFFTAYADNGATDAAATYDSTFSLALPTLADSLALVPVDGSPRVQFGFKSGLKVVKPGESLQAIVRDQDGINILNTTAEGRHALLIDDSPVPFDVTKFFTFDHGGTDTSGVMVYPLPMMPVGSHRAILRVSDSFAQTTLDTLEFSVTDPLDYFAEVVLNYPNPFATTTQFLIRVSNRASIRLDIFTVSGKRIRRLEEVRDGGEEWVFWDGRDAEGDEIANGTYLYVATVDFLDIERTPTVLRGKLTKIQ